MNSAISSPAKSKPCARSSRKRASRSSKRQRRGAAALVGQNAIEFGDKALYRGSERDAERLGAGLRRGRDYGMGRSLRRIFFVQHFLASLVHLADHFHLGGMPGAA